MGPILMNKLSVGEKFMLDFRFTKEDVDRFMDLSGDYNEIHFDERAAARCAIGKIAVPGLLSGQVFSRILGTLFPGHGTVYRSQTLQFRKPMFIGINYAAEVTVLEVEPHRHRAKVSTVIREKESGEVKLDGEAVVIHLERL